MGLAFTTDLVELAVPASPGADPLCENDEPVSPASSHQSSDMEGGSSEEEEEEEGLMELGEAAWPNALAGVDECQPSCRAELEGQRPGGHRAKWGRGHTALDLTRSPKVGGSFGFS